MKAADVVGRYWDLVQSAAQFGDRLIAQELLNNYSSPCFHLSVLCFRDQRVVVCAGHGLQCIVVCASSQVVNLLWNFLTLL